MIVYSVVVEDPEMGWDVIHSTYMDAWAANACAESLHTQRGRIISWQMINANVLDTFEPAMPIGGE